MQREELNTETAKIPWKELEKFFANGTTIYVSPDLDLIDVALEVCRDNKAQMEQWMAEEKVGQVSDGQAIEWLETDATVWSLVVKPWVLVQPLKV
ncbi:MAG: DUF2288 domain-containing protein [Porticoccus sp.]|nr:DUF2288 domain-containing protein [Porticoccus sp.]MBQ0807780.1 DUF2288 domain-containing protein [Porticoccus sp.]